MRAGTPDNNNSIAESRRLPRHRGRWRSGAPFTRGRGDKRYGSELGRQIAVDLESDANLDESRGRPRHGRSLSIRPATGQSSGRTASEQRLFKLNRNGHPGKSIASCPPAGTWTERELG